MSAQCDICSANLTSPSEGKTFSKDDVLTSPEYWKIVMKNPMIEMLGPEVGVNAFGMTIQQATSGSSGYVACPDCSKMLKSREKEREYELDLLLDKTGRHGNDTVFMVAATVWERVHGQWPSCIHDDIKRKKADITRQITASNKPVTKSKPPKPSAEKAGTTETTPGKKSWWQFWR